MSNGKESVVKKTNKGYKVISDFFFVVDVIKLISIFFLIWINGNKKKNINANPYDKLLK